MLLFDKISSNTKTFITISLHKSQIENMNNKVKDIDIKNRTYYFSNNIINIKNFDPNYIKTDENSLKNVFIYYMGYVTIKDSKYANIYSVNPLYLIFNKMNV